MNTLIKICYFLLAIAVFQVCAQPSRIKRQGFSWGDFDQDLNINSNGDRNTQRPRPRPTTQVSTPSNDGTTTTTPSPQYRNCIRDCPTTPQYNPICGTNRITYPNESHLRCANRCGLSVERAFGGTCQAL